MNKKDVKIKDNITLADKIGVINKIVDYMFMEDKNIKNGYLNYVHYFYNMATITLIATNLIDGIEFEEDDDIYEIVNSDEELLDVVNRFKNSPDGFFIEEEVKELLDFRKQEVLNNNASIFNHILNDENSIENKVKEILDKESKRIIAETKALQSAELLSRAQKEQVEYMNKVNEYMTPEETAELTRKMTESNFDPYSVAEVVTEKYLNSEKHKQNMVKLNDHKKSQKKKTQSKIHIIESKDE